MQISNASRSRGLVAAAVALSLAGCDDMPGSGLLYGAPPPPRPAEIAAPPQPDARGVIAYATYQVAVAREGDTLASVATRVGTTADELARLNGLPLDYRLRASEVLALPDSVPRGDASGAIATSPLGWSPEIAAQAIDSAPGTAAARPADNPFSNGQTEPLIDPIRHRVEPGETAYTIARLYGVSVTALASFNGLGPDLALRQNQELLIPIVSGANQITGTSEALPGQGTPVTPPPSAAAPLPEDIETAAAPASPELGQYRTPAGGRLRAPVDGPVTKQYNPGSGPSASEGIGYSVPAGTPVSAAGDGEVALVSESLGGLGTIVLIRHGDDLMTVYGRVDDVTVERGQRVTAGQTIGAVAPRDNPELHFEVRRGTDSVDPAPYLGG